jgi:iron(III) transport system substrate-binding protein
MRSLLRALGGLTAAVLLVCPPPASGGAITAYTALEEDDVKVYLDALAKEVPDLKVNVLRLSTGDLAARILAEKFNPRHDVIWATSSPSTTPRTPCTRSTRRS